MKLGIYHQLFVGLDRHLNYVMVEHLSAILSIRKKSLKLKSQALLNQWAALEVETGD